MLTVLGFLGSPPIGSWRALLVAALLGVSLHLLYYIEGHHEPQKVSVSMTYFLLLPAIAVTVTMIHVLTVT